MLEQYEIETIEQLRAIADLLRLRIVDILKEKPMTVTQLGEALGQAPAKVHYHVRELEKVGLLRLVETREKGLVLIPTKMYLKHGRIKCEIAVAKGKKLHDKRETERARTAEAEARAEMRRRA